MIRDKFDRLSKAHPDIQSAVKNVASKISFDVIVSCTTRSREDQAAAFKSGNSKAKFGQSPHNYSPALAVDLVPCDNDGKPDWTTIHLYKALAEEMKRELNITWGGDWKTFKDYPHFELPDWKDRVKTGEAILL